MTLTELYQKRFAQSCDKGTVHNYIQGYYEQAFTPLRDLPLQILELGVWQGGSLELWNAYYTQAQIWGIDVNPLRHKPESQRIHFVRKDAYTPECLNLFQDGTLDVIIDDGPHTLASQQWVLEHYMSKLAPSGLLIIEDIQSPKDLEALCQKARDLNLVWKVVDLRKDKGRYDDVILECRHQTPLNQPNPIVDKD